MQNSILWLWSQVWRLGSLRTEPYCIWALYPPQSMVNSMSALGNDIHPWYCHRRSTFCILTRLRQFANMEATPRSLFSSLVYDPFSLTLSFPSRYFLGFIFPQQESWVGRWDVQEMMQLIHKQGKWILVSPQNWSLPHLLASYCSVGQLRPVF